MDIPDKILEEVRFWRFKSVVLSILDPVISYSWSNPLPVYSGNKIVGHANLYVENGKLLADHVVEYATPERLEVEVGNRVWTLPNVEVYPATLTSPNAFTAIRIKRIELRTDCIDPDHNHIGEGVL